MTTKPMHFCALLFAGDDKSMPDLAALGAARTLANQSGTGARALILGPDAARILSMAMSLGLDEIVVASDPEAAQEWQPHQIVDRLVDMLDASRDVEDLPRDVFYLVSADPLHEEIAARLAARLGLATLGRIQTIRSDADGGVTAVRSAYGGRLRATQRITAGSATASIRTGAADTGTNTGTDSDSDSDPDSASASASASTSTSAAQPIMALRQTTVRHVTLRTPAQPAFEVIGCSEAEHNAPVDGAGIVVSGGRGVGDPAGFELLYEIAQQLGGAVGASLPAVDAGLAPVARQVGQSGKYVRPDIYLAVGISGTPQHMAGIDPHTRVVAVNADPEAPIFGMSRVGVVGDWKEILPALKRKLSQ